ncbi:hypothetical protein TIFTF001_029359 [Ficus carica]|uniref:Uncharacterized protein n=1 Tax=Ficus carica TaxID=3494 RepID=A0AA88DVU6_FICCA|nr:hypothetical protein TIFTF001_029359 [Ficus carica]
MESRLEDDLAVESQSEDDIAVDPKLARKITRFTRKFVTIRPHLCRHQISILLVVISLTTAAGIISYPTKPFWIMVFWVNL